jgi:eukaryotic-like serine/threonine-protein kinase
MAGAVGPAVVSLDKTWLDLPATADDPRLGTVLGGRYRLLRELGAGQVARVYVAEQIEMGRNVAVKLLLEDVELDDIAIHRFRQE